MKEKNWRSKNDSPAYVRVEEGAKPSFRLSEAMTASGAALDLESFAAGIYRDPFSRGVLRFLAAPWNINFEFQTWNYARRFNSWEGTFWDYTRMLTYQRFWTIETGSRWIEITDGSFFDNLGVYSLVRRGVSHIVVGDVTLDSKWNYGELKNLRIQISELFNNQGIEWCGDFPKDHEIIWYRKFWLKRSDGDFVLLHYLKPFAYNEDLFKGNPSLEKPENLTLVIVQNQIKEFI